MIGEVLMEVLIPLVMAKIVDVGIANGDVAFTVKWDLSWSPWQYSPFAAAHWAESLPQRQAWALLRM